MNMLNEVEYLALHLCVCSSLQKLHAAVLVQEDKKKTGTPVLLVYRSSRELCVHEFEETRRRC